MNNLFNVSKANWKTSVAGVGMLCVAIGTAITTLMDNDPETTLNVELLISEVIIAVGLIFARDGDKSSQDSGIQE